MKAIAAFALTLALTTPAHAQQQFSAAVSGYSTGGCYFLAFPVFSPAVEWFPLPVGTSVPSWVDDIETIDSADGQTVFALLRNTGDLQMVKIAPGGGANQNRTAFFTGLPGYRVLGDAFAVARDGRVFVVVVDSALASHLAVISSSGTLDNLFAFPSAARIAVGPDSCTITYSSQKVIGRFDGCSGTTLPSFATLNDRVIDVAVMSTGDVLAATSRGLVRLDATGNVVRTFTIAGVTSDPASPLLDAIAISPDSSVVAVAAMRYCQYGGIVVALSPDDGHELWRQDTTYISTATGLVLSATPAAIPALSNLALLFLGVALATAAALVLRR